MSEQEGPSIRINASCADCKHCVSDSTDYEDGDSYDTSWDISCSYFTPHRDVGSTWNTPNWCPFLVRKLESATEIKLHQAESGQ